MVSVTVERDRLIEAVTAVREGGFNHLADIFGIDYLAYPGHQGRRFTVAYNLYAIVEGARLFIRVDLMDGEELPTLTGLWRGANFMEREVFDMFGVSFQGHPNLRKLITPEDLDGHALRKDFPLDETATLFNEGRFLDPAAFRAGMMGRDPGLTGWSGGARKGVRSEQVLGVGDPKEEAE
jgi:NADH-quinone oxidoreductase subunit C